MTTNTRQHFKVRECGEMAHQLSQYEWIHLAGIHQSGGIQSYKKTLLRGHESSFPPSPHLCRPTCMVCLPRHCTTSSQAISASSSWGVHLWGPQSRSSFHAPECGADEWSMIRTPISAVTAVGHLKMMLALKGSSGTI